MGARLNRIDPRDFVAHQVVFVDKSGREYIKPTGRPRKVPREIRAQLYQLDLTVRETRAEIQRLLKECGVSLDNRDWYNVMARIRRERGA